MTRVKFFDDFVCGVDVTMSVISKSCTGPPKFRQYIVLVCLIWMLKSWFWGKLFIISVKRCGAFLCLYGLDDTFPLPVNMSLKYSGMVPFLYL